MADDFVELLRRAARAFPTQDAFAEALGISVSRLNRALNKRDYPLNVLNCLKLASIAGEPPSAVLRLAGKADVADLIDRLYGVTPLAPGLSQLAEDLDRVPLARRAEVVRMAAGVVNIAIELLGEPLAVSTVASNAAAGTTRARARHRSAPRKRRSA